MKLTGNRTYLSAAASYLLMLVSLYYKSQGHAIGETIPLVVLSTGTFASTVYFRKIAKPSTQD